MATPLHEDDCTLTVSSLGRNIHEEHLKEIFGYYGNVTMVNLAVDKAIGFPKGYAYIRFSDRKDAERAKERLNGGQIDGKVIKVDFILVPRQPLAAPRVQAKSQLVGSQRRQPIYVSKDHTSAGRRARRSLSPSSNVSFSRRRYDARDRRLPGRPLRDFRAREVSPRLSSMRYKQKVPSQRLLSRRPPPRHRSRSPPPQHDSRRYRNGSQSSSASRTSDSSASRGSSSNASRSSHSRPSSSTV
ncbi:Rna recognition motif-containing protein [Cardiosporidium cionae]|uniref:Rna recognition motif-containing protein n=1 Tax=Cardiosporidium cionae TaxID=476202 RepID=A0ABQ7JFR5_9APIC|nr:Rna recognition motif-containing protein [Cardiosporidium cionae]|eukprot:KAF8822719.1 Rna recognition motif-containing protein [Cardiosporidium cionae]